MIVREDDPAILVQWYFADPEANTLDFDSPFRSANWVNRYAEAGELGEQPGSRPWRDGKKPKNGYKGDQNSLDCIKSHEDWFTDGLPEGEENGPFNEDGVPLCCVNGPTPPPIDLCGCSTARSIDITLHCPANPCLDGLPLRVLWDESLLQWNNLGTEPQPCGTCYLELRWICLNAFPTQWLLLGQFREVPGGPANSCAGFSASVDFTQCLPISGASVSVWIPDFGPCPCSNGIVPDTVTFDAAPA